MFAHIIRWFSDNQLYKIFIGDLLSYLNKFHWFDVRQNIEIFFGKEGNSSKYITEGWRQPEISHRWTIGRRSGIRFTDLKLIKHVYLVVHLSAFIVPAKLEQQKVRVVCNGLFLCNWILESGKFVTKVIEVSGRMVLAQNELELYFETPDSNSPASLGISADNDELGICVSSITGIDRRFLQVSRYKVDIVKLCNHKEYCKYGKTSRNILNQQRAYDSVLDYKNKSKKVWGFKGFCDACGKKTEFLVDREDCLETGIDYREQLICSFCQLKSRQRFVVFLVFKLLENQKRKSTIYLYEQISPLFNFFAKKNNDYTVLGSEYFGELIKQGETLDGIRHENALALSFLDNSVDVALSCDVFEHVPDIDKAISESFRILKEDGKLIFTVPFCYSENSSIKRAELKNGNNNFICSPEYHGNPLDPKGSLVYYDFGWDIIDICKRAGFKEAYTLSYWGPCSGYLGAGEQFVFVAEK